MICEEHNHEKGLTPNLIRHWLDDETLRMLAEWSSVKNELERKQLCQKWRLSSRLHPPCLFESS